jgi:hypothetical protein
MEDAGSSRSGGRNQLGADVGDTRRQRPSVGTVGEDEDTTCCPAGRCPIQLSAPENVPVGQQGCCHGSGQVSPRDDAVIGRDSDGGGRGPRSHGRKRAIGVPAGHVPQPDRSVTASRGPDRPVSTQLGIVDAAWLGARKVRDLPAIADAPDDNAAIRLANENSVANCGQCDVGLGEDVRWDVGER